MCIIEDLNLVIPIYSSSMHFNLEFLVELVIIVLTTSPEDFLKVDVDPIMVSVGSFAILIQIIKIDSSILITYVSRLIILGAKSQEVIKLIDLFNLSIFWGDCNLMSLYWTSDSVNLLLILRNLVKFRRLLLLL